MIFTFCHCKGVPAKLFDTTNPDWVPNQNMVHVTAKDCAQSLSRYNRLKVRKQEQHSANPEDGLGTSEPQTDDTITSGLFELPLSGKLHACNYYSFN